MDWIKVTDKLPIRDELVLVTINRDESRWIERAFYDSENKVWLCNRTEDTEFMPLTNHLYGTVTYWMPYPAPAED